MSGDEIRQEILEFISSYYEEHRYPPTVREICEGVERSVVTVHGHLQTLHQQGKLTSVKGSPRTLLVVK